MTRLAVAALVGLLSTASAQAGVLGPADSAASEAARTGNEVLRATASANSTQASKAVDMLIELQPQKAGVDFSQRPGAAAQAAANRPASADAALRVPAEAATRASPIPVSNAGLFGTQATPPVVRDVPPPSSSAYNGSADSQRPAGGVQRVGSGSATELPWWVLPSEWLHRIREHRNWLVGLALLAAATAVTLRLLSRRWR